MYIVFIYTFVRSIHVQQHTVNCNRNQFNGFDKIRNAMATDFHMARPSVARRQTLYHHYVQTNSSSAWVYTSIPHAAGRPTRSNRQRANSSS